MFKGLAQHMWLLLTCRHNGKGLNTNKEVAIFIFALYAIVHETKYMLFTTESMSVTTLMLGLLFIIGFFAFLYNWLGVEKTNAFYLICLGTDLAAFPLMGANDGFAAIVLFLWLVVAWIKFLNIHKNK